MTFGTAIPYNQNVTMYAVVKPSATSSYHAIIGSTSANSGLSTLEYGVPNQDHQYIRVNNNTATAIGTTALNNGTWYTLAFTLNVSTGAYQLYVCFLLARAMQTAAAGRCLQFLEPTAYLTASSVPLLIFPGMERARSGDTCKESALPA